MKIERVLVSCYRYDVEMARLCVASVRFWYPSVPIFLVKDRQYGDFDTTDLEKYWGVGVYPTANRNLGWGFGKLEIIIEPEPHRTLLLDADIVFTGKVLERLEAFDQDFVVHDEHYDEAAVAKQFYPLDKIKQFDPSFRFPGFGFNTGQMVVTTGVLNRNDFTGLVDWESRKVCHPDLFQMGEQGVLNYIALRKVQEGTLSIRREPFMVWPGEPANTAHICVSDLTQQSPHTQLIHWAGLRWGRTLEQMPRRDILEHFANLYDERIPLGRSRRAIRKSSAQLTRTFVQPCKNVLNRVLARG